MKAEEKKININYVRQRRWIYKHIFWGQLRSSRRLIIHSELYKVSFDVLPINGESLFSALFNAWSDNIHAARFLFIYLFFS